MVLYREELVVTINTGIFICNTSTLKCRHINRNMGVYNLCVINNKVLIQGINFTWYTYTRNKGLEVLPTKNFNFNHLIPQVLKLEPRTVNNRALLMDNTDGDLYELSI